MEKKTNGNRVLIICLGIIIVILLLSKNIVPWIQENREYQQNLQESRQELGQFYQDPEKVISEINAAAERSGGDVLQMTKFVLRLTGHAGDHFGDSEETRAAEIIRFLEILNKEMNGSLVQPGTKDSVLVDTVSAVATGLMTNPAIDNIVLNANHFGMMIAEQAGFGEKEDPIPELRKTVNSGTFDVNWIVDALSDSENIAEIERNYQIEIYGEAGSE